MVSPVDNERTVYWNARAQSVLLLLECDEERLASGSARFVVPCSVDGTTREQVRLLRKAVHWICHDGDA